MAEPKQTKTVEHAEYPGITSEELKKIKKGIEDGKFALVQRIDEPGQATGIRYTYMNILGTGYQSEKGEKNSKKIEVNFFDLYSKKFETGTSNILAVLK